MHLFYIAPFPKTKSDQRCSSKYEINKNTLHKKFRPTQYRTTEQSKKITGFKSVTVKFK